MSTYAIGDVQGCYDALARLLDRIQFDPGKDRLWFCGDLVNRGGQSLEVLRLVYHLRQRVITVLGNHDLHMLAAAAAQRQGKKKKKNQNGPNAEFRRIFRAPDGNKLLHWLRHQPMMHTDEKRGYALVHAGLLPQWSIRRAEKCARELEAVLRGPKHAQFFRNMYGDQPAGWSKSLKGDDRLRLIVNAMTRIRFCDANGRMRLKEKGPPGNQPTGHYPWFEVPDRKVPKLTVLCGHWSALGLHHGERVIALDTGCVWGGPLTAINLKKPEKPIQVGGKKQ